MTLEYRWLILCFEAPLVAFGGVTIDAVGVTRDFPAVSQLTGLIANAMGWERTDGLAHQALQDRLVFAARRERESSFEMLTDSQNAQLEKNDRGWTTRGQPEGRDGASYNAPHRRQRDFHTDACVTVVLRLTPPDQAPDLDKVAAALDRPARPLFIGRKPCLPSAPLRRGEVVAPSAYDALTRIPFVDGGDFPLRASWPLAEGPEDGPDVFRVVALGDLRNWETGLHGGTRMVVEGRVAPVGNCSS
jgi:CRISPR system Cascade subunit CasD